ncbi:M56 family metallopeptidase [Oscillospiraceae bacterium MB08-C2-2]|nr:M56 family metallopeptidase [Oscillospiraceae bacterium MB08-C2-2]
MLDQFFFKILNMSFTGSIVILFVLLTRLLLKKIPKVFSYALWSVVLFRLICPFSFESVFSLLPTKASPIAQDIVYMQTPKIDTGVAIINSTVNEFLPAATPYASMNPLQFWLFIGSTVWVTGTVFMLSYSLLSLWSLTKKLENAIPYQNSIYLSDQIHTAFVLGVFRPKIYLPYRLSDGQREHILLHEQTHIKRFDHLVKLISFFVLCLHWFNPLVWVAFFASGKDMEMSCDEAVVKKLGNSIKKDYSSSLLTLASGRRMVGGTPLAFGEGDTKGRIKNVLSYKEPAFWVILAAAVAVTGVIVGLISNPKDKNITFVGVNAIILEIDKDTPSMTVEGIDENSVIGNRCIVTWKKDALITLATNSKPTQLSIDDFSVGDSVVLFIDGLQESYPARATASSIQLQPSGAMELVALRPMVMINGALYLDTGKESPLGAAHQVDGTIKTSVSPNKKPAEHEQSNFGFVGSEYVLGSDFVQVKIDGKWIVFEAEVSSTEDSVNALPARQDELTFFVKPDEPPQVIGETAAIIWLKSYMEESTPPVERIEDYNINAVTVISGTPKSGQNREDMSYHYVVRINYDITTASEEYFAPGDGVAGKGTFKGLFRELCVKDLGSGNFAIISAGTGGGESEFAQLS